MTASCGCDIFSSHFKIFQVPPVNREPVDHQVQKELPELLEQLVHRDLRDRRVAPDRLDRLDRLGSEELLETKGRKEPKVQLD